MDKGMKKVVNLVTNYMSALCETGRVPGRVDRNIKAGTAVYFPGGGAAEVIGSPEDCARVLAVTKGVKAWRDRRVGYWLCIDPKTGEYYLLTSANLAELNGLKARSSIYGHAITHTLNYRNDAH